jgi:signal transduction histidine kinase
VFQIIIASTVNVTSSKNLVEQTAGNRAGGESMEKIGAAETAKSLNRRLREGLTLYSRWLLLYVFMLMLGIMGDLAFCMLAPVSEFWGQIMPQLNYIGIAVAGGRFGVAAGLASACVAALSHLTLVMMACDQGLSQRGQLAMFAAIGLTVGLIANARSRVSVKSERANPASEEHNRTASLSELGRMMPDIVHQFRTPIASIEGAGFVLEDADLSDEKREEFVAIIRKECHRLEILVELLDFTQPGISTRQEVEIASLLDEVIGLCRLKTDRRIVFRNAARHDLPKLRYDPKLIRQAVHALTTNAILAISQNGELELSADLAGGDIIIRATAHGDRAGRPPETGTEQRHVGIDLAFLRDILSRHGGSVRVEPGVRGSIAFSMIVPLKSS